MNRKFLFILDLVLSISIASFVFYAGAMQIKIDTPDASSDNIAYNEAIKISQGRHKCGIVHITHYPNGHTYVLLPFVKIGLNGKEQLRWVPIACLTLTSGMWLFFLLRKSKAWFPKLIIFSLVLLLLSRPVYLEWLQCLHSQSYNLSIIFLLFIFCSLFQRVKVLLFLVGFVAGWFAYDWLIAETLVVFVARWSYYSTHERNRPLKKWLMAVRDSFVFILGILLAILAHLWQNSIYFGSLERAFKDLFGAAATRAGMEKGAEWNSGYYHYNLPFIKQRNFGNNRLLILNHIWKFFTHKFSIRSIYYVLFGCVLYQTWWLIASKVKRVKWLAIFQLLILISIIISGSCAWYILMPWSACCHVFLHYRHFFTPLLIFVFLLVVLNENRVAELGKRGMLILNFSGIIALSAAYMLWFWDNPKIKANVPRHKLVKNITDNMIRNAKFNLQLKNWEFWNEGKNESENISVVKTENLNTATNALRIENPKAKLMGVQQLIRVVSGEVYRLSASVRSSGNDSSKIFGGRIAFWLPPQKEKQIVWMTDYNKWWGKKLTFTNEVTGKAVVYVHMGYGNVASTGEFTNIRLERITD